MRTQTPLLRDKVVVVSGIGPGLGRSIALRSAAAGAKVVLAARTQSRLDEVAKEVAEAGGQAHPVRTDVTDDDSAQALVSSTLDTFGRVDALVNNAYGMPPMTDLLEVEFRKLRNSFETTLFGTLRLTTLFTPALAETGGSVVMVNSAVVRHSNQPWGPYRTTKASLLALAQSLATELGPRGIRVNTVLPGYIWADLMKLYFEHLAQERGVDPQVVYDEIAATMDLRRLPEADEIADVVVFLCSAMATAITGQCLDVNCGEFHN